jgi:2-phospho-L-lactate guanylyltransferase
VEHREHVVLVPVKPPAVGKSRLVGTSDEARRDLAAAFALDTVTACLAAPVVARVLAVTDDAGFAGRLAGLGCEVVPDGRPGDLNASLVLAAAEAQRRWPDLRPAAVCADLPALRPEDLAVVLVRVAEQDPSAAFVPDADGVGTTLYAARYADFRPEFGHGSRARHLAAGAVELDGVPATVRYDVDDITALHRADALGLGRHTSALLETHEGWATDR